MSASKAKISQRINALLTMAEQKNNCDFTTLVQVTITQKEKILDMATRHQTPFYLVDHNQLHANISSFLSAFDHHLPRFEAYYAIKANPHPSFLKACLKQGMGLDASSGAELQSALDQKSSSILFTGPGKTQEELELAFTNTDSITINLDSFRELEKVGTLAQAKMTMIRAGVRINTKYHGSWTKFGIPVEDLSRFWLEAQKYHYLKLEGIQFHSSFNASAAPYSMNIKTIAKHIKDNFTPEMRAQIKYFDFGGGFIPYKSEASYPSCSPQGKIIKAANDYFGKKTTFTNKYVYDDAIPVDQYALGISEAIHQYLDPLLTDCTYRCEPGRIICSNAMAVVLKVVDVKSHNTAILDGGINALGFGGERFDYSPVVNLTHPDDQEIDFTLYGSLCTPRDIWGFYCYAKQILENDIIIVLNQGAYTYSLAQNFIKPIPPVYDLD